MEEDNPVVYLGEEIFYEPLLKLLICRLHGNGVHPSNVAIKRHLRSHGSKGQALARVLDAVPKLQLASLVELHNVQAAGFENLDSRMLPIRYLKVLEGWRCVPCEDRFLTTSLELVQRHAAAVHGRRRGEPELWSECLLQTLFSETKDRRYFRVTRKDQKEAQYSQIMQQENQTDQESRAVEVASASPIGKLCRPPSKSTVKTSSLQDGLHNGQVPNMLRAIVPRHPFMSIAEKYVPLPGPRIDFLLKSAAFRSASMPIFDSCHMDAAINMQEVFPESEESPVWANALLYSTVQIMNHGVPTVEGQLLQKRTTQLMNRKLFFPDETLCSAAVGAIMVLKATAYKTGDFIAHDMHTEGLMKVLDYVSKAGSQLTPAARKAIFWLDMDSAAYIDSERQMSHLDLPPVVWRREMRPELVNFLPSGFEKHRDAITYGLLECVADLEEFQVHVRESRAAQISRSTRYAQLEPMQASITSRLVFQARACRQVGLLAEAVRVAVCICTYCSWMDTWNVSLLPCRLASEMFQLIDSILCPESLGFEDLWQGQMDLVFWLIFISSIAAELDEGLVKGVRARRDEMLKLVSRVLPLMARNKRQDPKLALLRALNNFIYVDGWRESRGSIPSWHQLEQDINTCIF